VRTRTNDLPCWDAPHVVYLCRDADGVLLYVGCTVDLGQRLGTHRSQSPWFRYAARTELYGGALPRDEALTLETSLILDLDPIFNRMPRRGPMFEAQRYLEKRGEGHLFKHPGWLMKPQKPAMEGRHAMPWSEWLARWKGGNQAWDDLLRAITDTRRASERRWRRDFRAARRSTIPTQRDPSDRPNRISEQTGAA
jgi:hypothetical protein